MGASTHPLSRGPADLTVYTDWPLGDLSAKLGWPGCLHWLPGAQQRARESSTLQHPRGVPSPHPQPLERTHTPPPSG